MLLALCHRCWTWIEPRQERCVECGDTVDLRQPDPEIEELQLLLGPAGAVMGQVSLKRPRLPSSGVLTAFQNGLLFLPDLRQLPSGGYVALDAQASSSSETTRSGFWNLFSRRFQADATSDVTIAVRPPLPTEIAAQRFLDIPGALFIQRSTIQRIIQRGTMLRVERKPGKTVAWRIDSPSAAFRDHIRQLTSQPGWSAVSVTAIG